MMDKSICREIFEKRFPFWDKLTTDQRERLCASTSLVHYGAGENIHGVSGGCTGTVFIVSGQARAYMLSEDGREITLYRLYAGDMCMLSASCVLNSITFDVHIDAEQESEVYVISPSALLQIMNENVYVENFALSVAVSRFSDVMWAMQQILFMNFDKRLAVFLVDELSRTGGDTVRMTHEQIAKYIGSAREVVSRMLKTFSAEGIVELSRGGVKVIDKKKLRELTE